MSGIKLLAMDVDGTMTDGKIHLSDKGEVFKSFCAKDGMGVRLLQKAGIRVAIITGRRSGIVERRARELAIEDVFQGIADKGEVISLLREKYNLSKEEIACVGDDINDLPMFDKSGLTFCPADGAVQTQADVVVKAAGGQGAIREVAAYLLQL